jgi:ATP-dependent DNA ligase
VNWRNYFLVADNLRVTPHRKPSAKCPRSQFFEKMKESVWVKPNAVVEIEFLEWTDASHLRHTKFVRLPDDKDPRTIVREG